MTTVATYAAPTPVSITPRNHACGVRLSPANSRSNHHAAATDTTNWKARMTENYSEGIA